jgi:hypothetical protein
MKPDRFPVQKGNRPPPPPPLVRKNRKPNRTESPERSKTPCLASASTAWTNSHNQNAELEYFPPVSLSSWYYTRAFFFSFLFLSFLARRNRIAGVDGSVQRCTYVGTPSLVRGRGILFFVPFPASFGYQIVFVVAFRFRNFVGCRSIQMLVDGRRCR